MKSFTRFILRPSAALLVGLTSSVYAFLPTVQSAATDQAHPSDLSGIIRAGVGLVFVVGLIFACAWLARRFGLQQKSSGSLLKVVSSVMVGQRERVVVVEIEGTWLVLGVTAGQINFLHTLEAKKGASAAVSPISTSTLFADAFAQQIMKALGKKPTTGLTQ
jgi:flagellar protein FliO/FliZ